MKNPLELLRKDGINKNLRACAYVYATMMQKNTVDLLDCLIPLIAYALRPMSGSQYDNKCVMDSIEKTFPFLKLSPYMLSEITPKLQRKEIIEKRGNSFFVKNTEKMQDDILGDISSENDSMSHIDEIIADLGEYSLSQFQLLIPKSFNSWESALIAFFQRGMEEYEPSLIPEFLIIGSFIREVVSKDTGMIRLCSQLYYSTSVMDMISSIPGNISLGITSLNDLEVYYDTTVIMRLLGTSGNMLHDITMQMHNSLKTWDAEHSV